MSIPTTFRSPTVFWTGAGAVRHHPAYGASRPIRTTDHWVATSCLSSWLWKRLAPGRGFEPQPTGSKPMVLTVTPARKMVRKVRFELTRPCGHQILNLARLPFRHMRFLVGRVGFEPTTFPMSRFYGPLASASLHTFRHKRCRRDLKVNPSS